VNNEGFYWEIKDILTQFVAAFDDATIKRYDKNRSARELVKVRYVVAPKERVMYDIVNKTHNLTLPAVAINIGSISRDQSRVFNKIEPSYYPGRPNSSGQATAAKIYNPIPINIEVSMSILCKYMADMDQIISNFVPYSNPYIILSWPVPQEFGLAQTTEIRSEVLWSGSINYTSPIDIASTEKFRIVADTSFTIKTWLFREVVDPANIIYKVDANFYSVRSSDVLFSADEYNVLSGIDFTTTDVITVSAIPSFTNWFYNAGGVVLPVTENTSLTLREPVSFVMYGRSLDFNNTFYLSGNNPNMFPSSEQIITAKSPTIEAFNVSQYSAVFGNNIATINIPLSTIQEPGIFTIVSANSAGWGNVDGYVNIFD
jgi:hypothetical protein